MLQWEETRAKFGVADECYHTVKAQNIPSVVGMRAGGGKMKEGVQGSWGTWVKKTLTFNVDKSGSRLGLRRPAQQTLRPVSPVASPTACLPF